MTLHRESIMPAISFSLPEERIIFLSMAIDSDIRNTYGGLESGVHSYTVVISHYKSQMLNKPQSAAGWRSCGEMSHIQFDSNLILP